MSELKVRLARPEDLPELESLRRSMPYPGSLFLDQESYYGEALLRLRELLPRLEDLPDWRVLVLTEEDLPRGYLLLILDQEHGITHQRQGHILDLAVFSFEGLSQLVDRARGWVTGFENEYLVVDLAAADKRMQLWFYRCGFRAEQQRVARRIPRGHQGPSSPLYRLRQATLGDLPFILEVHRAYSAAYLPGGREMDLKEVEFRYQMLYLGLDLDSPKNHYLIMEEVSSELPVAYLLLQEGPLFARQRSLYVYDVAVAPAFSGRGLSVYLKGAAESLAGREGGILYGDGSLGPRVIASWHAQLGYQPDSLRFALDCRE